MTRIQFKVYDETGKRAAVHEINIPVSIAAGIKYVEDECERLSTIKYPPLTEAGKESSCTARTYQDPVVELCHRAEKTLKQNIVSEHHSPTGASPNVR